MHRLDGVRENEEKEWTPLSRRMGMSHLPKVRGGEPVANGKGGLKGIYRCVDLSLEELHGGESFIGLSPKIYVGEGKGGGRFIPSILVRGELFPCSQVHGVETGPGKAGK